jgi:hypothetical protein
MFDDKRLGILQVFPYIYVISAIAADSVFEYFPGKTLFQV